MSIIDTEVPVLNVTLLEPRQKHPTIFNWFDELRGGEAFQILNDHDPKPLYYQLLGERGNIFTWQYLENGPQWWRIQIRKNAAGETIGEIVAKDVRKAEVFKKYGIDFCCGGKKSLQQACEEKGVSLAEVTAALDTPQAVATGAAVHQFNQWGLDFLSDYIYNQHHVYYYEQMPAILDLLVKVHGHHGAAHPELEQLYRLFVRLKDELDEHFAKEEKVVFPFIKALVQARKAGTPAARQQLASLAPALEVMQADHEAAGELLEEARKLTGGYTPPADGCNSYRFLFRKLQELDEDLRQHIHLENNILFPKALRLEQELRS